MKKSIKLRLYQGYMPFMALLLASCIYPPPPPPPAYSGVSSAGRDPVLLICPADEGQKNAAQASVHRYLTHKHSRPAGRYIAVDTLPPNKTQKAAYVKKVAEEKQKAAAKNEKLSDRWVEPSALKCVCVWDTVSQQFVGSNCYVVGGNLQTGETDVFETRASTYVGSGVYE
jgi:hypothetical protein